MNVELTFLTALQSFHSPALDTVMLFFTHLGDSGFIWAALTAVLLELLKDADPSVKAQLRLALLT